MADMGKKEDRRVRRTRKLLTQALTDLMQRKQVNEITVKELTDAADMNRGTFYLYYKDIFDMIEKVEDQIFNKLNAIFTLREKCLRVYMESEPTANEEDFEYRYSFTVHGCAGIIGTWVGMNCPEEPEQMAELTNRMILYGGIG